MTLKEAQKLTFPCELIRTNYPNCGCKEGDKIIALRLEDTSIMDNKGIGHYVINVELPEAKPEAKEADSFERWYKENANMINLATYIRLSSKRAYTAGQTSAKPRQYTPSELYTYLKAYQALEGISDKALAEDVGLSVLTIKRLATNSGEIRYSTVIQVIKFLKL